MCLFPKTFPLYFLEMVWKGCGTIGQGRMLEFLFGFHNCNNIFYLFLVGVGFALVLCVGLTGLGLPWAGLADSVWLGLAWLGLPGLAWPGCWAEVWELRADSWSLRVECWGLGAEGCCLRADSWLGLACWHCWSGYGLAGCAELVGLILLKWLHVCPYAVWYWIV